MFETVICRKAFKSNPESDRFKTRRREPLKFTFNIFELQSFLQVSNGLFLFRFTHCKSIFITYGHQIEEQVSEPLDTKHTFLSSTLSSKFNCGKRDCSVSSKRSFANFFSSCKAFISPTSYSFQTQFTA